MKNQVYREYQITSRVTGQYEIDHLIPLELDGENSVANLWPEPNDHPTAHNDHGYPVPNSKDLLEDHLHTLVCAGKLDLATAQQTIAANWITAYTRYMPIN